MRVKICGITRLEDAQLAMDLGASAIGLVFWPGSPRFIDPAQAESIVRALPPFVTPVGVFVDQPQEYVNEVAARVGLSTVQLHGRESRQYCNGVQRRVIRAIGVEDTLDPDTLTSWPRDVMLLLDAHDDEKRGGTGRPVNWTLAGRIAAIRPAILAGGLRPENVAEAIAVVHPYAVDVSSGVEARPGIKDPDRMRAFFQAIDTMRPKWPKEDP